VVLQLLVFLLQLHGLLIVISTVAIHHYIIAVATIPVAICLILLHQLLVEFLALEFEVVLVFQQDLVLHFQLVEPVVDKNDLLLQVGFLEVDALVLLEELRIGVFEHVVLLLGILVFTLESGDDLVELGNVSALVQHFLIDDVQLLLLLLHLTLRFFVFRCGGLQFFAQACGLLLEFGVGLVEFLVGAFELLVFVAHLLIHEHHVIQLLLPLAFTAVFVQ